MRDKVYFTLSHLEGYSGIICTLFNELTLLTRPVQARLIQECSSGENNPVYQFTRCLHAFRQISSLVINGEIIEEREVESCGQVLQEVVCWMRYGKGYLRSTRGFIS